MAALGSRRQRERKANNRVAVFLVIAFIVCMAFVIQARINTVRTKIQAYQQKENMLSEQIREQEERKTYLEAQEIHVKTDEYKIEVAREKLGLVFPDEIIIKPE